jgi:hypothetical protein
MCKTCTQTLKWLSVAGSDLTDSAIIAIAESFPDLEYLNIGATHVTDFGIQTLLSNTLKLQTLNISQCSQLTEVSIIMSSLELISLDDIEISGQMSSSSARLVVLVQRSIYHSFTERIYTSAWTEAHSSLWMLLYTNARTTLAQTDTQITSGYRRRQMFKVHKSILIHTVEITQAMGDCIGDSVATW